MNETVLPEELRIGITDKCNLKCKHCYVNNGEDNGKRIAVEDFLSLLEEMKNHLKSVSITGGNPLMVKEDVFSICKKCDELGMKTRLVTNGTMLTDEIVNKLKELNLDIIQIGVDSIDTKFHDFIRIEGAKEKTIRGIKKCIKAGIKVSIRYTLARSNIDQLIPTYEYFSKLGAYKFKLRMLFPAGSAKKHLNNELINGQEWAQAQFRIIEESIKGTRVEITQPCLFEIPIEYNAYKDSCPCGLKAAYLDWKGYVKYCLFDEYTIGNIKERPLTQIWSSPLMLKERKKRHPTNSHFECSSFAILRDQYDDYNKFIKEYIDEYKKLEENL